MRGVLCSVWGHKPDRKRVWDDGLTFRCRCTRCHRSMIRAIEGWRLYDPGKDDDPRRSTHHLPPIRGMP